MCMTSECIHDTADAAFRMNMLIQNTVNNIKKELCELREYILYCESVGFKHESSQIIASALKQYIDLTLLNTNG